ncbi:MAG: DUF4347 domain-containing protein [Planctomycetota bacterium]
MQNRLIDWWQCRWTVACRYRRASRQFQRSFTSQCVLEDRVLLSATPIDLGVIAAETAPPSSVTQGNAIVFVDSAVPDLADLLGELNATAPDAEVFVLTGDRDGVDQVTEILESRDAIEELHFISHAGGDGVQLGDIWLGSTNLPAYAAQIASWRDALTQSADMLFYGCDLASTMSGREFLESMAELTLADVAASDDDTGHTSLRADWELEHQVGAIGAQVLFGQTFHQGWLNTLSGNVDAPGSPVIVGDAVEDDTLSVDVGAISDADGMTTSVFQYQWLRDGVVIAGATTSSYTLGDQDVGQEISVAVSFQDDAGNQERLTSDPTTPVKNVNDDPTGLPAINGTAAEHETLTVTIGTLQDDDGLPSTTAVRWLRDGNPIVGATSFSYVLTANDVGSVISVRLTYVDGQGTVEQVTSAATAPVINVNDAPTVEDRKRSIAFGRKQLVVGSRVFERASNDADGDALTAVLVKAPSVGQLDLNPDGSFTYVFEPEFVGVVTFEWAASDGVLTSDPATVQFVVAPPVEPPGDLPSDTGDVVDTGSGGDVGSDAPIIRQGLDPAGSSDRRDVQKAGRFSHSIRAATGSIVPTSIPNIGNFQAVTTNRFTERSTQVGVAETDSSLSVDEIASSVGIGLMNPEQSRLNGIALTAGSVLLDERSDSAGDSITKLFGDERLVAGSLGVATSGVTLVGLAWAMRSGILLLGLYQQKPLWSRMDPLLLMQGVNVKDDESLADVMEEQRRRLEQSERQDSNGDES